MTRFLIDWYPEWFRRLDALHEAAGEGSLDEELTSLMDRMPDACVDLMAFMDEFEIDHHFAAEQHIWDDDMLRIARLVLVVPHQGEAFHVRMRSNFKPAPSFDEMRAGLNAERWF